MQSRQLSLMIVCMTTSIGLSLAACGNDIPSLPSLNEACSQDKPCAEGLVCGNDGKCIEKPAEKPGLNEDCNAEQNCKEGLICGDEGKCIEKPAEKPGQGEPCSESNVCREGLECKDGTCAQKDSESKPDACEGVMCLDGQGCIDGRCYDNECIVDNAVKHCENGEMCSKGECVDDGCQNVTCDEGKVCVKGLCEDKLCLENAIICNAGATCVKGECVDNECLSQTCDNGLVCSKGECVYPACVSKEACALGKICNEAGECVFAENPALKAVPDTTETNENGGVATISLTLNNPPAQTVTVTCALENAEGEAEVNCDGILFDAQNFSEIQDVYVAGLADNLIDEDKNYSLTITTVSEDPEFHDLTQKLDLVNKNVDTVGLRVTSEELLTTTESGGSAVFSVVLKTKPEADVTFVVATDHPELGEIEGAVENKLTVTFTPENWDIPQEIKVVGVDDGETPNGVEEHTYQIIFENTVSEDANYNGLEIKPINAVNLDNDVAQVFLDKENLVTEEGGIAVDITMRLGLMPTEDVNVMVTLLESDRTTVTDEIALDSEQKFVINQDNYKDGVHIVLHGIDDHIIDGDQDYVVHIQFNSFDNQYKALPEIWLDGKNIDKNVAGLSKNYTETKVSEDGTTLDVGLSLMSMPTAPVTVDLSISDETEISINTKQLVFTSENWDQEQLVTVTGLNDVIIDGDVVSEFAMYLTSEDVHFGGDGAEILPLSDKLEITTLDNDTAEIVVIAEGAEILENSDKILEFKVTLSAQPTSEVVVNAKSMDESELVIVGQPTLVFNEGNWNQAQTVFLKVQDDGVADGNQLVQIQLSSTSMDSDFDALKASSPAYNVLDNEQASIAVTLAKTTLVPGDYTTTVSVALSAPPLSDVTVTLKTTNANTAALSQTSLVFTTANWSTPQVVTLTNANPQSAPSAKSIETISAVAAGEGQYNGLKSNNADVTLYAFKEQSFAYTGNVQSIALLPGRYKLEARGASGAFGWDMEVGGLGGYAQGTYQLATASTMYVVVGGKGIVGTGGYNGGGPSTNGPAGGGATHIALSGNRGVLKNYASYQSEVLIVAGGGGGSERCLGGAGGGATGGAGDVAGCTGGYAAYTKVTPAGGTQSAGGSAGTNNHGTGGAGSFGQGGSGISPSSGDNGPGGGGGWYGGGGMPYYGGGGGGSGRLGAGVTGSMNNGVNDGHGSAKITLLD